MYGFGSYGSLPYAGQMLALTPTTTAAVSSWTANRPRLVLRPATSAWVALQAVLPPTTQRVWGFGNFGPLAMAEITPGTAGVPSAPAAISTWTAKSPRLALRAPAAISTWVARGITSFVLSAEMLEVLAEASGHANLVDSAELLEVAAAPSSADFADSAELLEVLAANAGTANLDVSAELLEVAAAPSGANFVDSAEILEVLVAWPGTAVGVCRSQLM